MEQFFVGKARPTSSYCFLVFSQAYIFGEEIKPFELKTDFLQSLGQKGNMKQVCSVRKDLFQFFWLLPGKFYRESNIHLLRYTVQLKVKSCCSKKLLLLKLRSHIVGSEEEDS